MDKKKLAIWAVVILTLTSLVLVTAYETTYNPFTGKMDYVGIAASNATLTNVKNITFGDTGQAWINWNGTSLIIQVA